MISQPIVDPKLHVCWFENCSPFFCLYQTTNRTAEVLTFSIIVIENNNKSLHHFEVILALF